MAPALVNGGATSNHQEPTGPSVTEEPSVLGDLWHGCLRKIPPKHSEMGLVALRAIYRAAIYDRWGK